MTAKKPPNVPMVRRRERSVRGAAALASALLLALGACTRTEDVPPGTVVLCAGDSECPSGRVCNRGRCIRTSELGSPPDLMGGIVEVTPARGSAGTAFAVALEATRALEAPPRVILGLDPLRELACTSAGGNRFTCPYLATGAENAGRGGRVPIDVRMVDLSGNETARNGVGVLELDFDPPVLAAQSAVPDPVPLGGVLQVFFATDEDLGAPAVLLASRPLDEPGGTTLAPVRQPGTRNWIFTHLVTSQDGPGRVEFTAALTDAVGNSTTVPVGAVDIDVIGPRISALRVSPGRIRDAGVLTVTFDTDEAAAPGSLAVSVGERAMTCAPRSPGSPGYACTRAMVGDEIPAGAEVAQSVVVSLSDAAGNRSTASGSTVFDFRPPAVASADLSYAAPDASPIPTVARAAPGARVTVTVIPDEPLDPAVVPSLAAALGARTLPFTFLAAASSPTSASFEAFVPEGLPDGDYAPSVAWVDPAGNLVRTGVGLPAVKVKTSRPALVVDEAALVFVRSPQGSGADEVLGPYTIPAGPYFAVEPDDPLAATASLPAGSLLLAGGAVPSLVIVQDSSAQDALVLGALRPDAAGRFPRRKLSSQDAVAAFLVGVDDAGNRSTPVLLGRAEWIATTHRPPFTPTPHVLSATSQVADTRAQERGAIHLAPADASAPDSAAVVARAAGLWSQVDWNGVRPPARGQLGMAYDTARARAVVFGGFDGNTASLGDTWEWDGSRWTEVASDGPGRRAGHAMVYDSARARVVLFGGVSDAGGIQQDTWAWDGTVWTRLATVGPAPRTGFAMAYDSARDRVVLFGGRVAGAAAGDTWEWDGVGWTRVATAGPAPRNDHAMAYDARRGQVVLFGGFAADSQGDTWAWNGASWTQVAATGPTGRSRAVMTYDSARERVVLFGGGNIDIERLNETWEWDGSSWALRSAAGPGGRFEPGFVYDAARRRVVMFGGWNGASTAFADAWEWDGAFWGPAATNGPAARAFAALAYDSNRGRAVLFGGGTSSVAVLGDTFTWGGAGWAQAATSGPPARQLHAMAHDSTRGRTVLFGGAASGNVPLGDTWEWNGASWTQVAATGPGARSGHALAYDAFRGVTVLFGGEGSTGSLGDTWTWNGTVWTLVATGGPPAQSRHAMAYDASRRLVVLFGGRETWLWNGTSWLLAATTGPGDAGLRRDAALAYDAARRRIVLFGGTANGAGQRDTWEWTGTAWTLVATGGGPTARSGHAMAYEAARDQVVLFGGASLSARLQDSWTWRAPPDHRPAVQLSVSLGALGVDPARIGRVAVRAHAGGTHAAGAGATLLGWERRGAANEPGGWVPLAVNTVGVAGAPPYLPAPAASLLPFASASAAGAAALLDPREGSYTFQVRPSGGAGSDPAGAAVALDYLEVRIRYAP